MVAPTVPLPAMVVLLVAVSAMALVSGASMRGRHGQGQQQGQLRMGFYSSSCPAAEKIIGDYVRLHVRRAPTVAPALLRLHYHDCFVSGCDGSILLNSTGTGGQQAEKDAAPNLTLRGFDLIDRVKTAVEEACPGVVSCADVLALAARDAVAAIGGPSWRVPTGRRDGTVSSVQDALRELPNPAMSFTELAALFAGKGLGVRDLVWLSGAHTIGVAHCSSFADRLYGYPGAGNGTDPSLDATYAANLGYYRAVLKHRGLLGSDAALVTDAAARADIASVVASPPEVFFQVFGRSMAKLGAVQVKTGSQGEIRKSCAVVNSSYQN